MPATPLRRLMHDTTERPPAVGANAIIACSGTCMQPISWPLSTGYTKVLWPVIPKSDERLAARNVRQASLSLANRRFPIGHLFCLLHLRFSCPPFVVVILYFLFFPFSSCWCCWRNRRFVERSSLSLTSHPTLERRSPSFTLQNYRIYLLLVLITTSDSVEEPAYL